MTTATIDFDSTIAEQWQRAYRFVNARLTSRRWAYKIALLCTLNSLFWAFPSYQRIFTHDSAINDYLRAWERIDEQAEHPLTPYEYLPTLHEAKVAFRLLAPLIARYSPFKTLNGRMAYLFFLQHLAGFLFFFYLALFVFRYGQDKVLALIVPLTVSLSYLGHSFFYELYGWFDGFAFILMLMGMYYYRKWYCALLLFLSFWVDERAIVGSGIVCLFALTQEDGVPRPFQFKSLFVKAIPFLTAYAVYALARYQLQVTFGLKAPVGTEYDAGIGVIIQQATNLPLATFLSFEATWIIFILGVIMMWQPGLRLVTSFYLLNFAVVALISYSVWDVTRSLMYGFPIFLVSLRYLLSSLSLKHRLMILGAVLMLNLIVPSYKNHYHQFYWQIPLPVKAVYYLETFHEQ